MELRVDHAGKARDKPTNSPPHAKRALRFLLFAFVQLGLFAVIAGAFWYQDLRYSLPTPKPTRLMQTAVGSRAPLSAATAKYLGRATVFHFYSPACPCSRFNVDHVRWLEKEFGNDVRFVLVLSGGALDDLRREFSNLGVSAEPIYDVDASFAKSLGVYSTPQAVILDRQGRIYYRGNYNASRFCAERKTEYVRIALEQISANKPAPTMPIAATVSYGCAIQDRTAGEPQ